MGHDNKGFSWTERGRMSKSMGKCERERKQMVRVEGQVEARWQRP